MALHKHLNRTSLVPWNIIGTAYFNILLQSMITFLFKIFKEEIQFIFIILYHSIFICIRNKSGNILYRYIISCSYITVALPNIFIIYYINTIHINILL